MSWCLLEVFLKFLKASIFMNVLEIRHWTMELLPSRGSFILTLVLFLSALSSEISSSFSKSCSLQAFNSFVRAANSWKGNKKKLKTYTRFLKNVFQQEGKKTSKYKLLSVKNRKKWPIWLYIAVMYTYIAVIKSTSFQHWTNASPWYLTYTYYYNTLFRWEYKIYFRMYQI